MNFKLYIKPSAVKESRKIPASIKGKIRKALSDLVINPMPHGVKKLQGRQSVYRIRVGEYRVLYTVDDLSNSIHILSILHRREAYR